MAKMTVDVNEKLLDKAVKKELRSLKRRVEVLERQKKNLELEIYHNKTILDKANNIVLAVKEAGDFREEWDDNA